MGTGGVGQQQAEVIGSTSPVQNTRYASSCTATANEALGVRAANARRRLISSVGDRPVLVGDVCRFGDRTGTVMHIGLRSTRLRTAERTIISVPNGQFSSMALENISGRDKIWFHPTMNLRRDTTSDQLLQVLSSFQEILSGHSKVESGPIPVRFIGVGPYSLDVEVAAYIKTSDYDEFLALQQELLLRMLQAVEHAGTALAVPLQESFDSQKAPSTRSSNV